MIRVAGVRVAMEVRGSGRPLVLIHGLGCSGRYFRDLAAQLSPHFTVYVPDLPGHGRSEKPDALGSIRALGDWLAALVVECKLEQPVIAGHSLGGGVAVDCAARYPDLPGGIVLLAPTGVPDMPRFFGQVRRIAQDAFREPLRLYPLIIPAYVQAGPRRILRLALDQRRYGQRQALGKIRAPMLVIRGSRDPIDDQTDMDELVAAVTGSQSIKVPGAAHALNVSHPEPVAAAIKAFVHTFS